MISRQMVAKDNDLIGAKYSLGVAEQRLIFLAIIEARAQDKLIDAMGLLRINAASYQKQFNVSRQTAYEALKSAVNGLFYAELEYSQVDKASGKMGHHKRRWVEHVVYIDDLACVELKFTSSIIPLITRLDECYTEYDLKQVSSLRSEYALRLYELLIQWRSVGKTPKIKLEDLRNKLGVEAEHYTAMSDFKKRVLKLALKQINDHTDITADFEQHKTGRAITDISFKFKLKPVQIETIAENRVKKMTDKQISTFSSKLAALPELGSNAPMGASTAEFAALIASDLADPVKHQKYTKHLAKVGYQKTKNKTAL